MNTCSFHEAEVIETYVLNEGTFEHLPVREIAASRAIIAKLLKFIIASSKAVESTIFRDVSSTTF